MQSPHPAPPDPRDTAPRNDGRAGEPKPAGSRRLIQGLVIVIALWGIYLAIGATGVFTDVGLFDARRSAIVLACSAAFLGLWIFFLKRQRAPRPAANGSQPNRASIASLIAALLAYGLWAAAWAAWLGQNPFNLTYILGWISVALFGLAALLAIIGLSDPLRERGKLLGLVTLALLLLAAVGLVVQIWRYTSS